MERPDAVPERHTRRVSRAFVSAVLLLVLAVVLGTAAGGVAASDHDDRPEIAATFNATGVEGFVAINQTDLADPIAFPTPNETDRPIALEGVVFDDGTWRSTNVSFPALGEEQLGFDIEILLETPRPFEGEIDRDSGELVVDGALDIVVPVADARVGVAATLTTGESGAMSGDATGLDTGTATVTVVNNTFTVPRATGDPFIDGFVGLPAPEPGTNWFSLTLEMDIDDDPDTGTASGVVESADGEPIAGATVSTPVAETTTDSDGTYELGALAGTREVTVDAPGFTGINRTVTVTRDETTTLDATLEADPARFEPVAVLTDDVAPGESVSVTGLVQNVGEGSGVRDVTLSVGDAAVTETLELTAGRVGVVDLEWQTDTGDRGEYEARLDTGDATASESVLVGEALTLGVGVDPETGVEPGDTVTVEGSVTNSGDSATSTAVTVSVADESVTETVTVGPGGEETVTLEWVTDESDAGEQTATVESDATADPVSTTVLVGEVDVDADSVDFVAESTGGYIRFRADSYEAAVGTGLRFPDRAEEQPIVIAGTIDESAGTWESVTTFFPRLTDPRYDFGGEVRAVDGLEGEIDREEGYLTINGTFEVLIEGREDTSFTFTAGLSSEASGDIPADVATFDVDGDTATANVVSNDYPVTDRTGDGIIDGELDLPSPEPGDNYLELGFRFDFDPDPGTVENISGDEPNSSDDSATGGVGDALVLFGQGLGLAAFVGLGAFGVVLSLRRSG